MPRASFTVNRDRNAAGNEGQAAGKWSRQGRSAGRDKWRDEEFVSVVGPLGSETHPPRAVEKGASTGEYGKRTGDCREFVGG